MSLHTFEMTDLCGIICKQCVEKESPPAAGAGPSVPIIGNCSLLDDSSNVTEGPAGEEVLVDPGTLSPVNGDPQNSDIEVSLEPSHTPLPGLVYLFEKELSVTDCYQKSGRFLVPKIYAQQYFPRLKETKRHVVIKDTEGRSWKLTLRWFYNDNTQKYVLCGTRDCISTMNWAAGDKLRFFKQPADGQLVMELVKAGASASTSAGAVMNPEMNME